MLLPPYSADGPPAWSVNGSAEVKLNVAGTLPEPRLQMAKTGSTTAVEKLRVLVLVFPPVSATALKALGGALSTVPPLKEPVGVQLG
jgi:hypothetical protein